MRLPVPVPVLRRGLALLLLAAAAPPSPAAEAVETFTGIARLADGSVYYVERHRVEWRGERPVTSFTRYSDAAGQSFGEMDSRFPAPTPAPYTPAYRFEDRRLGRSDQLQIHGDRAETRAIAGDGSPEKSGNYALAPDLVSGQGLHFLLRARLAAFVDDPGFELHARLLIPLDAAIYPLRVRRLALDDGRLTLRIDIDHWLYRLFAPHMDIAYDVRSRRLLWYEGPTHILDALRAVRTVRIDYRYGSEAAAAGAIPDHHAAAGSTTSIAIGR
ncbi:MAG TPA: hypothetical protein PLP91_00810 [Plasticicumulans sp.]|uniref:hypothetical protein n=1 Tax=Plasticicumulans sp. TaxID=2307179 RepID=UPI002C404FA0|nr:hypothetical protein [Plasticicumulans sp.]HMV38614.1 hypothetical protein [Plasticicumulans sp.]HMW29159.1 hypothetical protein [Plasticicumulans sp.]HMW43107.1 hypothetical protein [Plasticicumulans sp.]HMX54212.1 hypothetical protein [Plasticicumulans sp.]HNB88899.1 hypothetical protein [Plasticicumulans sp.]